MLPRVSKIKEAALDFLFPRCCIMRGKEGEFVCAACLAEVSKLESPVCHLCGKPVSSGTICAACALTKPVFDSARAPLQFHKAIRKAIHEYKYNNLRALSGFFTKFLYEYILENKISFDVIVPVPLHPNKLKECGYNQSTLICRELGKFLMYLHRKISGGLNIPPRRQIPHRLSKGKIM